MWQKMVRYPFSQLTNEMKLMQKTHQDIKIMGLKCDNPQCDWRDTTIKFAEYPQWLNAPCPKCGANVLTQEDFDKAMQLYNNPPLDPWYIRVIKSPFIVFGKWILKKYIRLIYQTSIAQLLLALSDFSHDPQVVRKALKTDYSQAMWAVQPILRQHRDDLAPLLVDMETRHNTTHVTDQLHFSVTDDGKLAMELVDTKYHMYSRCDGDVIEIQPYDHDWQDFGIPAQPYSA